ncbi:MAG: 4a-hydroxytetrahydrobiopterin dehydratase [Flavobacteriaceae bacterium]
MEKLSVSAIQDKLVLAEGWELKDNGIEKKFVFKNFKQAFSAMTHIAMECEVHNHHPEWSNVYNQLHIRFSTHDAGGLTDADFKLAGLVNQIIN